MSRALYICYFGVREPLVQTQVIPYLRELAKDGHELLLLTFEPSPNEIRAAEEGIRQRFEAEGIGWEWLTYHKSPSVPATLFDMVHGAFFAARLSRKRKIDIFHVRGQIAGPIGGLAKTLIGGRLLFDIRGFIPEEYVDAGVWSDGGVVYRTYKQVEKWLMRKADAFVVLTEAAREELFPGSSASGYDRAGRPVEVIPCCVDFTRRFKNIAAYDRGAVRTELSVEGRFVIAHVGAVGGLYLTEEMADLIAAAKEFDPRVYAIFLTQSDPGLIVPLLEERGLTSNDYLVKSVPAAEVPRYLVAADVGLSFVKSSYATLSRSPTKIPEYLACGLPVIANAGVGDVDKLMETEGVGALVRSFNDRSYIDAIKAVRAMKDASEERKCLARSEFDLETVGGARYRRVYSRISDGS